MIDVLGLPVPPPQVTASAASTASPPGTCLRLFALLSLARHSPQKSHTYIDLGALSLRPLSPRLPLCLDLRDAGSRNGVTPGERHR